VLPEIPSCFSMAEQGERPDVSKEEAEPSTIVGDVGGSDGQIAVQSTDAAQVEPADIAQDGKEDVVLDETEKDADQDEPDDVCQAETQAVEQDEPDRSEQDDVIVGDYKWRTKDGRSEALLRLQPGGRWWHSAYHRLGSNKAAKDDDHWELAESLGSWREVSRDSGNAIVLFFEHCRWATDKPELQASLRPSEQGREEIDALTCDGKLGVCLTCQPERRLELEMEYLPGDAADGAHPTGLTVDEWVNSVKSVYRRLGVVRHYAVDVVCEDGDSYDPKPPRQEDHPEEFVQGTPFSGLFWSVPATLAN